MVQADDDVKDPLEDLGIDIVDITGNPNAVMIQDGETWYDAAMRVWLLHYGRSIKYVSERQLFCQYTTGVYEIRSAEEWIYGKIHDVIDSLYKMKVGDDGKPHYKHFDVTGDKITQFRKLLESRMSTPLEFFDTPGLICCEDGILSFDPPTIKPHDADILFLNKYPMHFLGELQDTPCWEHIRATYPDAVNHTEQMIYAAITQDGSAEMMHFLFGETGSGKGTITQLYERIFAGLCGHTQFVDMGLPFGKANIIHKRVNVDREMTIGFFTKEAVSFLKNVITMEGPIEVNEKFVKQYDAIFHVWFVGAANQASQLPQGTDRTAWFRRTLIDVLDKTQKKDPTFKNAVLDEADAIFTNIILKHPKIPLPEDLSAFVQRNADIWDYWSDPILRICKNHIKYSPNETNSLKVDTLIDFVTDALNEMRINMKEHDIKAGLTTALNTMKIKKMANRVRYKNIVFTSHEWWNDYKECNPNETSVPEPETNIDTTKIKPPTEEELKEKPFYRKHESAGQQHFDVDKLLGKKEEPDHNNSDPAIGGGE